MAIGDDERRTRNSMPTARMKWIGVLVFVAGGLLFGRGVRDWNQEPISPGRYSGNNILR
jgi:hypothetical protein